MSQLKNKDLSKIFKDMSSIYEYIGGEERFRAIAYRKASKVIDNLNEDIAFYSNSDALDELSGIGKSISEKIKEYLKTGKIKKYEALKKSVPHELIDMMEINGFGPQSLKIIHQELNVSKRNELIKALKDGSVSKLKGFGKKKVEKMLQGLKIHKDIENRMLLWDALTLGDSILLSLKEFPEIIQAELAGSLRRRKETIGDIDIVVSSKRKDRKKIIDRFVSQNFVKQVIAKGETKASVILKEANKQVDVRVVEESEWGAALQYFTGSKEHNIHLREIAKEKGYKINEYGIFEIRNDKYIAGKTEEEIYKTIRYQLMPPEMREDIGEIELSEKHKIPHLITNEDILGDLHLHSNWSDGINSIEEIVEYVKKTFKYEYIAITDHSKSSRIANGMDEKKILKQIKEIKKINEKLGENFVKTGLEVDILSDGKLDISDEILAQLEWVTASIHNNFNKDNTNRIIKSCENKYVSSIGHPTGRLIGSREPYKVNMDEIIEVAKYTNTSLEINSQPNRMDLNDQWTMKAREKGIMLAIVSDSHAFPNFDYLKLGVSIARRGWCKKENILNTMSWTQINNFLKNKKKLKPAELNSLN